MKKMSDTEILKKILECKEELGLDTLPNATELYEHGIYSSQMKRVGGLRTVSQLTGIPMKPRQPRTERNQSYTDRTKIRSADLKHWSAEKQKADTLARVGSIDTSKYGVEKVKEL